MFQISTDSNQVGTDTQNTPGDTLTGSTVLITYQCRLPGSGGLPLLEYILKQSDTSHGVFDTLLYSVGNDQCNTMQYKIVYIVSR
jgi:hypothetical protein